MENILFFLNWQLNEIIELTQLFSYLGLYSFIYIIFFLIYRKLKKEYMVFDLEITKWEKKVYVKIFFYYFLWAGIQQSIVLGAINLMNINGFLAVVIAIGIFSILFHLPNLPLMLITFCLGSVLYTFYYIFDFQSLILMFLTHSIGGTLLANMGFDTHVLFSYKKDKWFSLDWTD